MGWMRAKTEIVGIGIIVVGVVVVVNGEGEMRLSTKTYLRHVLLKKRPGVRARSFPVTSSRQGVSQPHRADPCSLWQAVGGVGQSHLFFAVDAGCFTRHQLNATNCKAGNFIDEFSFVGHLTT